MLQQPIHSLVALFDTQFITNEQLYIYRQQEVESNKKKKTHNNSQTTNA